MNKIKILDSTTLKIIAAIAMVIDHIGIIFFPNVLILRYIGRLAFPIFAFCIAEGYKHTKNKYIYFIKLFGFAFITEPIFDLALYGSFYYTLHQNVLFTFSFAVLYLILRDYIRKNKGLKDMVYFVPEVILYLFFVAIALIVKFDYNVYGLTLVLLFDIFNFNENSKYFAIPIFQLLTQKGYYLYSIFSNIFIYLYNGKKGYNLKYFFYIFYPLHLLILYIIKLII